MNYATVTLIPGNKCDDPKRLPAPPIPQGTSRLGTVGLVMADNPNHQPGRIQCLTCPAVFESWCRKQNRICPMCHKRRAKDVRNSRAREPEE